MKIVVVNVNTSQSMTDVIAAAACRYASPGTEIVPSQPYFGAEAVDCKFESYLSAVAVMDRMSPTASLMTQSSWPALASTAVKESRS